MTKYICEKRGGDFFPIEKMEEEQTNENGEEEKEETDESTA